MTEPFGRVTVTFVHDTAWFAARVIVAASRTVEPSSGELETSAGACEVTVPLPPTLGGAAIGVWFATARVNGATAFAAASLSAFSAGVE